MTVQDKGGLPRGLINGFAPPYSLYSSALVIKQQVHFRVGPVAENRRASQSVARCVMVKFSVAGRRRFIAPGSFCQSVGVG